MTISISTRDIFEKKVKRKKVQKESKESYVSPRYDTNAIPIPAAITSILVTVMFPFGRLGSW